jgi:undecaprenyl-diphosphatase
MSDLDRSIQSGVVDHRIGALNWLFEALSYVGSFGLVWLAIAVAISGFSWSRPWLWTRVGAAILLAESISGALKIWVQRDRPPVSRPVPEPLLESPSTYSFPSGHPLFALAVLISFSRVYVGVHYPFDVLAGAVLGVGIAIALRTLAAVLRRSEPRMRRG